MKVRPKDKTVSIAVEVHNFALLYLQFLKFFANISDSFKFQKFQTQNMKAMPKDKKVSIAVIQL